jgi:hypothetical protein
LRGAGFGALSAAGIYVRIAFGLLVPPSPLFRSAEFGRLSGIGAIAKAASPRHPPAAVIDNEDNSEDERDGKDDDEAHGPTYP